MDRGRRCLPSDQDPCQGVTYRGACEGGVLTWCEAGVVVSRDCGACGETCTEGAVDVGFICQPSDCGDLDYQGRCEGNVAHWCRAGGQRDTRDCAAQNQVCGYVGRETGYFCMDAGACGEVGYMGVCEGGTSIWCDEGRRRSLACTDDGRVCRYVNDNVGNYCTDCGDVDYRGQCEGATARWCNDRGQLETRDCAAQGEVCRYVDDDTGFFCADP